jgi:hypothetical protein
VGAAVDVGAVVGSCDGGGAELPCADRDGAELADLLFEGGILALPLNRPVDVGDGDTVVPVVPVDGAKIDGMDDEDPAVQAETDAERRRVAVAQPAAASLDLLTLMRPPSTRQAAA